MGACFRIRRDDGAMAVEFAVVFPLVAILLGGMITFGAIYTAQLSLKQAAREGVRVYALGSGDPFAVTQNAAQQSGLPSVSVSTSGDCPDPDNPPDPAPASWVEAGFTYEFPFAFAPVDQFPLTARAVMRCGG